MAKPTRYDYNYDGSVSDRPKIIMKQFDWFKTFKRLADIIQRAGQKWGNDKVPRIASSLAFYIGLSLAPMLIFAVAAVGIFYSGQAINVQRYLSEEIAPQFGDDVVEMITTILRQTDNTNEGLFASLISLGVVMFSASNLFYQLQDAFDTIWRVPPKHTKGVINLLTSRLRAILAVILVGVLLIGVVLLNSIVSQIERFIQTYTPFFTTVLPALNAVATLFLLTFMFMVIFRRMTQAKIRSSDVILGAFVTALLFQVGNFALVFYISNASVGSAYGAAGSLLVVLVWFFYTMQILLFGAEVSYIYAYEYGTRKVLVSEPGPDGERVLEAVSNMPQSAETPPEQSTTTEDNGSFLDNLRARFSRS